MPFLPGKSSSREEWQQVNWSYLKRWEKGEGLTPPTGGRCPWAWRLMVRASSCWEIDQVGACFSLLQHLAVIGLFSLALRPVCLGAFKQTLSFSGKNCNPLTHWNLRSLSKKLGVSGNIGYWSANVENLWDWSSARTILSVCVWVYARVCIFMYARVSACGVKKAKRKTSPFKVLFVELWF